jgi:predicted alpha-1,6-mannanase (GH76 family)
MLRITLLALYIQLGAALANRVSVDQKQSYLDAATAGWNWFFNIGVVNTDHFVVDGVDYSTCKPTGIIYTYNQGVILGAAAELYHATGNGTYLDQASKIANAVTAKGSPLINANGILMDSCDRTTSCSGSGEEFKGPFVKNLRKLQLARGNQKWVEFLEANAQSIWNNDLQVSNGDCLVGLYWAGPYSTADSISQGIALDCLVAAFAVTL